MTYEKTIKRYYSQETCKYLFFVVVKQQMKEFLRVEKK